MATIINESALGLLCLRVHQGPRFTFDMGRVWMEFPNPAGGWRPPVEIRNPERFGTVPTTSAPKDLKAGKAWVSEFEVQAAA